MITYKDIGTVVKNLPAMQEMQEMWVRSLGQEGALEEGMAIHSSILSWRIPWTEKPGKLQVHGAAESWTRLSANTLAMITFLLRIIFKTKSLLITVFNSF